MKLRDLNFKPEVGDTFAVLDEHDSRRIVVYRCMDFRMGVRIKKLADWSFTDAHELGMYELVAHFTNSNSPLLLTGLEIKSAEAVSAESG